VPVTTVFTRAALRSAARGDLVVPRTRRRLGNRAFSVAGFTAWNSLPQDIRTAPSLRIYSRLIYSSSHIIQLNFECRMLYGALVVTLWTCYGALQIVMLLLLLLLLLYRRGREKTKEEGAISLKIHLNLYTSVRALIYKTTLKARLYLANVAAICLTERVAVE